MEVYADTAPCSKQGQQISLALGEKLQLPESAQATQLASGETNLNSVYASSIQD